MALGVLLELKVVQLVDQVVVAANTVELLAQEVLETRHPHLLLKETLVEMLQAGLLEEVVVGQTLLLEQVVMRHLVLVVTGVTVLLLASQALL